MRGKHTKKHTSRDIAIEISKWTNLLPRAFPVTRLSQTLDAPIFSLMKKDSPSKQSSNSVERFWLGWMPDTDIGFSTEPIALSHEILAKFDLFIFLFSGTYVLGRFYHWLKDA